MENTGKVSVFFGSGNNKMTRKREITHTKRFRLVLINVFSVNKLYKKRDVMIRFMIL